MHKKFAATLGLGIFAVWQIALYPLLFRKRHPGYDGFWRFCFEYNQIWK